MNLRDSPRIECSGKSADRTNAPNHIGVGSAQRGQRLTSREHQRARTPIQRAHAVIDFVVRHRRGAQQENARCQKDNPDCPKLGAHANLTLIVALLPIITACHDVSLSITCVDHRSSDGRIPAGPGRTLQERTHRRIDKVVEIAHCLPGSAVPDSHLLNHAAKGAASWFRAFGGILPGRRSGPGERRGNHKSDFLEGRLQDRQRFSGLISGGRSFLRSS